MTYSKERPFYSQIKERLPLTCPDSPKQTHHIVLDLKDSGLKYKAGDCIGVLVDNPESLVEATLQALGATGKETITRKGQEHNLKEYLTKEANISTLNRGLATKFFKNTLSRDECKAYCESHTLAELLSSHEHTFSLQEICEKLTALMPRFYSIASSMHEVGEEVHLTVRHIAGGVCTEFLCETAPVRETTIPLYVQPTESFCLPEDDDTPIIMIGPGTGVAPYRSFLQERLARGAKGANWLFFGEWTREGHFLYGDYWTKLERLGHLKLDVAFSRDQEEKVYVQHLMNRQAEELFRWLKEGATLYVCGDAGQMAPAVDQALRQIIEDQGDTDASAYIRELRRSKRYLRDIY